MIRLLPAGEAAVLVELTEPDDVLPLTAGLQEQRPATVTELIPAERTVLVGFDPALTSGDEVARWIRGVQPIAPAAAGSDVVEVPVEYDGEDLGEVASLLGISDDDVVRAHTEVLWTVAFSGFAPGFGYLRPPDGRLAVPRRDTSRSRVPPGAVALAAGYSGVYPRASPGGWQLIGHTGAVLWDPSRWDDGDRSPALLQPGDRVRFRAVL